jgi:hypothetical protein
MNSVFITVPAVRGYSKSFSSVGADGGRACTDYHAVLVSSLKRKKHQPG